MEKIMPLSMYQASVPVLIRALGNLKAVLAKGQAHAQAKGTDEANYLTMRLVPDMLPFAVQVRIATDIAKRGVSRLAGIEPPVHADDETDFAGLMARCDAVIAFLKTITADKPIVLPTPRGELNFTGQPFLFGFVIPNVHFHSTMTYALLRGIGVELGKTDYLGGS
jgi:uncharacterized protein